MKKSCIILLLLVLVIPLWFAACKPDKPHEPKPELPPITQEGKNTFGCLMNGEVLAVPFGASSSDCYYYYFKHEQDLYGTFSLRFSSTINKETKSININLYDCVFDTGKYRLDEKYEFSKLLRVSSLSFKKQRYYCRENMFGEINILHIDTIKHIISGTFSCDMVNETNINDTVHVREGRFDSEFIY
ncbi:MAG TPA: hypothetical protein VEC12_13505 [Bacteroidia bacterium]|nr:hypothetical protein [Bacteroidia bacterium]